MDIRDIQNLIKFVSKSGVNEVKLETKEFKISIKTTPDYNGVPMVSNMPMPSFAPPTVSIENSSVSASQPAKAEANSDDNSKYVTITSPMIGTFYRKPAPDKPVFVNVGDMVSAGNVVCIIEAMKLFNEIESEVSGKIVKILVDDASPVEFGQPLYLVDPS